MNAMNETREEQRLRMMEEEIVQQLKVRLADIQTRKEEEQKKAREESKARTEAFNKKLQALQFNAFVRARRHIRDALHELFKFSPTNKQESSFYYESIRCLEVIHEGMVVRQKKLASMEEGQ